MEKYFNSSVKTDIVNIIGHEMKTPIQAILTYSELLQNNDEPRGDYLRAILRNAQRLKMLSSNLSDMAKIESGTLRLKREPFDLRLLAVTITEDFRNMMKFQDKHDIEISVTSQGCTVAEADKERIAEVMLNLVDNAVKVTTAGSISVRLEETGDSITCTVTDTGPGIDDVISPVLFTKFATSSEHGTGLGLYICKSIVKAHHGDIWVEDTEVGATIAFRIPKRRVSSDYTKFLNSEMVP